jgi:FkbM family methyltransferase
MTEIMPLRNWVKRTLTRAVKAALPQSVVDRLIRHYSIPNVDWSLRNAKKNGFTPKVIVDVGAYVGDWSRMAHRIFPESHILAVEPQADKKPALRSLSRAHERVQYETALLGAEAEAEVSFQLNETVSSVLPEAQGTAPKRETRALTTFDAMVENSVFTQPDLVKLDVQGYELEVLRGAENTLATHPPELILMEVSLLEINEGAPLVAEVVQFMGQRNYQLYDVGSFMRRPYDDALWQMDAFFVRTDSELVKSRRWG